MKYAITHNTKYAYGQPVAVCHDLVRLSPREGPTQRCGNYSLTVFPEPNDLVQRTDAFGNTVEYFSIEQAHRGLSLSATSEVEVVDQPAPGPGPAWELVRDSVAEAERGGMAPPVQFAFASPLVPLSAKLAAYASHSFGPSRPIIEALQEFTERIHNDFTYDPRATTVSTPVEQVFAGRAGVCQDFAHVAIACLRSLGLAARYVSGYLRTLPPPGEPRLVGADASHAWLSLYCGDGQWIDADPTNNRFTGVDHITLAHGRDYSDACPVQGVYLGGGDHTMDVFVDVVPVA